MLNSKVAKNIFSKFLFWFLGFMVIARNIFNNLSINYFSKSISKNKLANVLPCEIYINQVTNILEADYQIRKSISFFPEIKNINCLNKISNIVLNDFVLLEAVTILDLLVISVVNYFVTIFIHIFIER